MSTHRATVDERAFEARCVVYRQAKCALDRGASEAEIRALLARLSQGASEPDSDSR